jgi:NitT/TauT family transport system ATP-binding protein
MSHALLEVEDLRHTYRTRQGDQTVLDGVNFEVRRGEFASIVGPSGCGKTTLLRTLSGLLRPTRGTISLSGEVITGVPQGLAMVFQDYRASLFPWRRVGANVEFPLLGRVPKAERRSRTAESLAAVGLADAADKYPWQLSGGMQQRVSIARALGFEPKLLMMDEPFGALDEITRDRLNEQLLRLWERERRTVVFVTHSIPEAVFLSSRIVVMSPRPGRIVDVIESGLPADRTLEIRDTPEFAEISHRVRMSLQGGHGDH